MKSPAYSGERGLETYRSIIVMMGATRPEAHAAEVMSERNRHGRSLVFHFWALMATGEEVEEDVRGDKDCLEAFSNASELDASLRCALMVMVGGNDD